MSDEPLFISEDETCAVRLQPEASYTRLTPICGRKAKGLMPRRNARLWQRSTLRIALDDHAKAESG